MWCTSVKLGSRARASELVTLRSVSAWRPLQYTALQDVNPASQSHYDPRRQKHLVKAAQGELQFIKAATSWPSCPQHSSASRDGQLALAKTRPLDTVVLHAAVSGPCNVYTFRQRRGNILSTLSSLYVRSVVTKSNDQRKEQAHSRAGTAGRPLLHIETLI